MAGFRTELEGREISEGRWALLSPLVYESDIAKAVFNIPTGFVTDFSSVPRVPIAYLLFGDRAHREAVVHDYLYQTHSTSKRVADKVFLEAMKLRGKSRFVRVSMYWGVVCGGRKAYKTGPSRYTILNQNPEV